MSVAITFVRVGIYNEKFPSTKSPDPFDHVVLQGHVN